MAIFQRRCSTTALLFVLLLAWCCYSSSAGKLAAAKVRCEYRDPAGCIFCECKCKRAKGGGCERDTGNCENKSILCFIVACECVVSLIGCWANLWGPFLLRIDPSPIRAQWKQEGHGTFLVQIFSKNYYWLISLIINNFCRLLKIQTFSKFELHLKFTYLLDFTNYEK